MWPFSPQTKLPRELKLSYPLKFLLSCLMRCEFLFVSLLACAESNTVESAARDLARILSQPILKKFAALTMVVLQ